MNEQTEQRTKRCTACGRTLLRSAFHKNGPSLQGRCKECISALKRAQYAADPSRQKAANRSYIQRYPERRAAQQARWVQRHRAHYLAYQRRYYQEVLRPRRTRRQDNKEPKEQ